ncbi:MAG: LemA family protein [Lentisphaerae bacterium GWF2_44_16]|nr:MAG: LemA family protein [Lentisphaerae bacterium GWF2_44_16]
MKAFLALGAAFFLLIVIVFGFIIIVRNGLISKDEKVKESWAQIDTQLQRRADLIPNLVNTVKGYAKHEKDIFENVSNARGRLLSAKGPEQKAAASAELSGFMGRLLAIAENYPDLKANTNFIRLQDELAGTENRISVARTRYNDAVKTFNASIRKIPGSMFADGLGFKSAEYFQPADKTKVQQPPEVKF